MKITHALVVKLVDTKDLKAVGFTDESVHRSPRQSKHPIKSHNFNLALNLYKEIKLIEYLKTSTRPVHREIDII